MKLKEDISQIDFVKDIMEFTQNLCENCFQDFQEFLRDQTTLVSDIVSTNIVNEVSTFLVNICENIDKEDILKNNSLYSRIIIQSLQTLTDLCLGPCLKN